MSFHSPSDQTLHTGNQKTPRASALGVCSFSAFPPRTCVNSSLRAALSAATEISHKSTEIARVPLGGLVFATKLSESLVTRWPRVTGRVLSGSEKDSYSNRRCLGLDLKHSQRIFSAISVARAFRNEGMNFGTWRARPRLVQSRQRGSRFRERKSARCCRVDPAGPRR